MAAPSVNRHAENSEPLEIPNVPTRRKFVRGAGLEIIQQYIVDGCPFCGRAHLHSASVGLRIAHCVLEPGQDTRQYRLLEPPNGDRIRLAELRRENDKMLLGKFRRRHARRRA